MKSPWEALHPARPDASEKRKVGDLRDMQQAQCVCGNVWWAPVIGRCPKCRAGGATILDNMMIGAPRV